MHYGHLTSIVDIGRTSIDKLRIAIFPLAAIVTAAVLAAALGLATPVMIAGRAATVAAAAVITTVVLGGPQPSLKPDLGSPLLRDHFLVVIFHGLQLRGRGSIILSVSRNSRLHDWGGGGSGHAAHHRDG